MSRSTNFYNLLFENDDEQSKPSSLFNTPSEVESLIHEIKETSKKIAEEYDKKIEGLKYEFSSSGYTKQISTLLEFFKDLLNGITDQAVLLKSKDIDEFNKKIEDIAKDVVKGYFANMEKKYKDFKDHFGFLGAKNEKSGGKQIYDSVLKQLDIIFVPEHDLKVATDAVRTIMERIANADKNMSEKDLKDNTEKAVVSLIYYLAQDENFMKKLSVNYLRTVVQKCAPGILSGFGSGIKEFFKSPLSAMKKLKDAVKNIYDKIGDKYGRVGQFIAVVAIVALIWIAIKKIPILGRFFGKLEKWLMMPINKIKSFFSKAPGLLEAYLSDPVARRLIETKIRRMDMYATMYLSV